MSDYSFKELQSVDNLHFYNFKGGYSVGDHLFPYRTEKLSPTALMILPVGGKVGRRPSYFNKRSQIDL